MKTEMWLMALALLAVIALGGLMAMHTALEAQAEAAELAQVRADAAVAEAYWRRVARLRPYVLPVQGAAVSSAVGYRLDPMGGAEEALHKGLDFPAPQGTPVAAALGGVVAEHWLAPGVHGGKEYAGHPVYGGYIVLDHGGGLYTCYGHLSATEWQDGVHRGRYVSAGQIIGAVGHTGISTGDHLHFELVIDPLRYLGEGG